MSRLQHFDMTWLEVFAESPLNGNLHVVIHDADALDTETMARAAERFRLAETSYVQRSAAADADYRHRIFSVAGELPFAGHPSVGTAAAVAHRSGATTAELTQETIAGLQRLRVSIGPGESGNIEAEVDLRQNPPEHLGSAEPEALVLALGLEASAAHGELRPAVISTGLSTMILPLRDPAALACISLDLPALTRAMGAMASRPVTCYAVTPLDETGAAWQARCFTAQVASGEDAATGSAAGPLMAYAHRNKGVESISITQGVEMGAHSRLRGRVAEGTVIVSGRARIIGSGTIELPVGDLAAAAE